MHGHAHLHKETPLDSIHCKQLHFKNSSSLLVALLAVDDMEHVEKSKKKNFTDNYV